MRFLEEGPDIPDDLIEARNNGQVLFLCGAGVSQPQLPSFIKLAEDVLSKLGVDENSKVWRLLKSSEKPQFGDPDFAPQIDQIFDFLELEYPKETIHRFITEALSPEKVENLDQHKTLLKLATGIDGQPQLITTNYDHFFEKAAKELQLNLPIYEPPHFPNLLKVHDLKGLVYLHGKLIIPLNELAIQNIVVSKSDFGRAYLVDKWATNFLIKALQHHRLVLVGYSANDPVVSYLLQGLKSSSSNFAQSIYAFESSNSDKSATSWKNKGVTPLFYPENPSHSFLWSSLTKWAEMIEKPESWASKMIALAQKHPSEIAPFQRKQVVNFIQSKEGARAFASCDPSPPPAWITVLDGNLRTSADYELDDDPLTRDETNSNPSYVDYLSGFQEESSFNSLSSSPENHGNLQRPLPDYLYSISNWICQNLRSPLLLWWLIGKRNFHPDFRQRLTDSFQNISEDEILWRNFILTVREQLTRDSEYDFWPSYRSHSFCKFVKTYGWGNFTIQEFQRINEPVIIIKRKATYIAIEAQTQFEQGTYPSVDRFVDIDIQFPKIDPEEISIPDDWLFQINLALSSHLNRASFHMKQVGNPFFTQESLHLADPGKQFGFDNQPHFFLHAVSRLFDRLADYSPEKAALICQLWDESDPFLQGQLTLYALRHSNAFSASAVAKRLHIMSDEAFWGPYTRPELLQTLFSCWPRLSEAEKGDLEEKILRGRPPYPNEVDSDHKNFVNKEAATILGWLRFKKAKLTPSTNSKLNALIAQQEQWDEDSLHGLENPKPPIAGRYIRTDEDSQGLEHLDLSVTIPSAMKLTGERKSFVEKQPFQGLIKSHPRRAFLALCLHARTTKEYPLDLWASFLNNYTESYNKRLLFFVSNKVLILPEKQFADLSSHWVDFLKNHIKSLAKVHTKQTRSLWERTLDRFLQLPESHLVSGLDSSYVGGVKQNLSRRTYEHAFNSPAGKLTYCLFDYARETRIKSERVIPNILVEAWNRLLALPGEAADYAVIEITIHSNLLNWLDSVWVKSNLRPLFAANSKFYEPAWNGFLHQEELPTNSLFQSLKEDFIAITKDYKNLCWESQIKSRIGDFAAGGTMHLDQREPTFSSQELRNILKSLDSHARACAIDFIRRSLHNNTQVWSEFGELFFKNIWPFENKYQDEASTNAMIHLLKDCGEKFEEVAHVLLPRLCPVESFWKLTHRFGEDNAGFPNPEALKHPSLFLDILDQTIPNKTNFHTQGLGDTLKKLAEIDPELKKSPKYRKMLKLI